jgi:hypothetical protein
VEAGRGLILAVFNGIQHLADSRFNETEFHRFLCEREFPHALR